MKRKLIRVFLALLVLLGLPLTAWRMYLAHVINKQLAEIRAAGLPTNGEELNHWYPAVPDNQNAALLLTQAFTLLKTINTISDKRADQVWKLKDRFPRRADLLTTEQVNLIRWYVETNQSALMKATEAFKRPASRYPIDWTRLMNAELPHLAHLANLAYLHQCRSALADRAGRNEAAATDIVAILGLARTLDNEPCLISQLVRLQIFRMAIHALELRVNAGALTAAEIATFDETFHQIRATNIAAFALIGERALTIPYFHMTKAEYEKIHPPTKGDDSRNGSLLACNGSTILKFVGYYELDFGTYLIGMNKAIALSSNAPPENLRASGYFARVGEESTKRRRTLSGLLFSNYAGCWRRENEAIANQRLAATALAVESFRNDNGKLPESLDNLVPNYFEEVPEDPFTGLELEYRCTEQGYVIYSVGPDREDNSGLEKADKKQSDDKKFYDITFTVER